MTPHRVIGSASDREIVFQSPKAIKTKVHPSGTLQEWKDNVAARVIGNSRHVLAISFAVAAPCLKFVNQDGGGIHLWGDSTGGKTTIFRVLGASMVVALMGT